MILSFCARSQFAECPAESTDLSETPKSHAEDFYTLFITVSYNALVAPLQNYDSEDTALSRGVPQGSVLGPLGVGLSTVTLLIRF